MEFSRDEYWNGLPFPFPGIFLTQGLNPGLLHCRQILYCLSHQGRVCWDHLMFSFHGRCCNCRVFLVTGPACGCLHGGDVTAVGVRVPVQWPWAWGLESGPLWVSCSSCAQGAGRPAAVLGREPEMREQSCCLLGSTGQPSRLWGWVYPGVECCQLWLWAVRQRHCWGPQWQRLPGPHKPGHGTTVVPAVWLVLLDHLLL